MDSLSSQIIIDILKQEMVLANDRVWLRDENYKIPEDKNLFVIVGLMNAEPMTNSVYMTSVTVDAVTTEYQVSEVQMKETIQIDVMSRSPAAKMRNWEVMAALQSIYGQQQQELNNFKIFRNQVGFTNTSGAEGGSNINRYSISVVCFVWYRKERKLNSPLGDYYDQFETRVDDATTIGTDTPLIEFEITPETPPPL